MINLQSNRRNSQWSHEQLNSLFRKMALTSKLRLLQCLPPSQCQGSPERQYLDGWWGDQVWVNPVYLGVKNIWKRLLLKLELKNKKPSQQTIRINLGCVCSYTLLLFSRIFNIVLQFGQDQHTSSLLTLNFMSLCTLSQALCAQLLSLGYHYSTTFLLPIYVVRKQRSNYLQRSKIIQVFHSTCTSCSPANSSSIKAAYLSRLSKGS